MINFLWSYLTLMCSLYCHSYYSQYLKSYFIMKKYVIIVTPNLTHLSSKPIKNCRLYYCNYSNH